MLMEFLAFLPGQHFPTGRGSLTFSQHIVSVLVAASIAIDDMPQIQTLQLMFISCSYHKNMGCFHFYHVKSLKWISLFVKIGMNYPQAVISTKLMKFAVLYTVSM